MSQPENEDFGGESGTDRFESQLDDDMEQKEREECPVPAALARRMFPHQKEGEQSSERVGALWLCVHH
jgi:hypothetical protein